VRFTARRSLELFGCHVVEAGTRGEAVASWHAGTFDAVIVDYRLPDGVGLDVVREMRGVGRGEPVVCLTAESESIEPADRVRLRIRTVLDKPLEISDLGSVIESLRSERCIPARGGGRAGRADAWTSSRVTRVGRFRLAACPRVMDVAAITRIGDEFAGEPWLALDMRETREMAPDVVARILEMGRERRGREGRLCVSGPAEGIRAVLASGGVDRELDVVDDIGELDALARRPASRCERAEVLDCVVRDKVA
jgi:CheY-like chemotaxis protein